jgi:hypothetical protein
VKRDIDRDGRIRGLVQSPTISFLRGTGTELTVIARWSTWHRQTSRQKKTGNETTHKRGHTFRFLLFAKRSLAMCHNLFLRTQEKTEILSFDNGEEISESRNVLIWGTDPILDIHIRSMFQKQ